LCIYGRFFNLGSRLCDLRRPGQPGLRHRGPPRGQGRARTEGTRALRPPPRICAHQRSDDRRMKGPADQRNIERTQDRRIISASKDSRTSGLEDQRIEGSAMDQGSEDRDHGINGSKDQAIKESENQRIRELNQQRTLNVTFLFQEFGHQTGYLEAFDQPASTNSTIHPCQIRAFTASRGRADCSLARFLVPNSSRQRARRWWGGKRAGVERCR